MPFHPSPFQYHSNAFYSPILELPLMYQISDNYLSEFTLPSHQHPYHLRSYFLHSSYRPGAVKMQNFSRWHQWLEANWYPWHRGYHNPRNHTGLVNMVVRFRVSPGHISLFASRYQIRFITINGWTRQGVFKAIFHNHFTIADISYLTKENICPTKLDPIKKIAYWLKLRSWRALS